MASLGCRHRVNSVGLVKTCLSVCRLPAIRFPTCTTTFSRLNLHSSASSLTTGGVEFNRHVHCTSGQLQTAKLKVETQPAVPDIEDVDMDYWHEAQRALVSEIKTDVTYDRTYSEDTSFLGGESCIKDGDIFRHLNDGDSILPSIDDCVKQERYLTMRFPCEMEFPGYRETATWVKDNATVMSKSICWQTSGEYSYLTISFPTAEDRMLAMSRLKGAELNGYPLHLVCDGTVTRRPLVGPVRTPFAMEKWATQHPSLPLSEKMDPSLGIALLFARLRNFPPAVQRQKKLAKCVSDLRELGQQLAESGESDWLPARLAEGDGFPCDLLGIVPSVYYHHYRHKAVFLISNGQGNNDLTIGYHFGVHEDDFHLAAVSRHKCTTHIAAVNPAVLHLQTCLRESKKFSYYRHYPPSGNFMWLMMRSTTLGDMVGVIVMTRYDREMCDVEEEKQRIADYFTTGPGKGSTLTACYLLITSAWSSGNHMLRGYHHCFGNMFLWEKMLGLTLRVAPNVFFQSNVLCTERLYTIVHKLLQVNKNTVLFDVGCGTGSVALTNAKFCKHCVGIDKSHQVILDAKFNAKLNGIENVTFHRGLHEVWVPRLLQAYSEKDEVVMTLDPERHGFPDEGFLDCIRRCKAVKRIVFIACRFSSSKRNVDTLCRFSKNYAADEGFRPVKAIVVDMFPQTRDTEWAMLLERTPPTPDSSSTLSAEEQLREVMSTSPDVAGECME